MVGRSINQVLKFMVGLMPGGLKFYLKSRLGEYASGYLIYGA